MSVAALAVALLAMGTAEGFPSPATGGPIEAVSITYVPRSPAVSLNEPVLVEVRIKNTGTGAVVGDLGFNSRGNFALTVTTPGGSITSPLVLQREGDLTQRGRLSLQPGEEWLGELILDEWYDFNEIGLYRLGLDLRGSFTALSEADVDVVATGTIPEEVTPRDPERLRGVCDRLAPIIESQGDVKRMFHAARVLTYVGDPIGVECIASVLSKTRLCDSILLKGLYRMGGEEAKRVLAKAARGEGERAGQAKAYLAMLAREGR